MRYLYQFRYCWVVAIVFFSCSWNGSVAYGSDYNAKSPNYTALSPILERLGGYVRYRPSSATFIGYWRPGHRLEFQIGNPIVGVDSSIQIRMVYPPILRNDILEIAAIDIPILLMDKAIAQAVDSNLRPRLVAIDPGHGGTDPGAIGVWGGYEKTYTLAIARDLMDILAQYQISSILLRVDDSNPSMQVRANTAMIFNSNLLVSIHLNAYSNPSTNGCGTYYYKAIDLPLATALQDELVALGRKDNGITRERLFMVRYPTIPAALVEPLFITNPVENKAVESRSNRFEIASAIAQGISRYLDPQ